MNASTGAKAHLDAIETHLAALRNLLCGDSGHTFPISAIDAQLLLVAHPAGSADKLQAWIEPLRLTCDRYEINTIRRVAAFLATLAHESGFVPGRRENMNFSADRLAAVWPARFRGPNAKAKALHRKPEAIANEVYADRMGNGSPESGDGWRFRGNGPTQLTGRANHQAFADAMGMTLDEATTWIGTIDGGIASAGWFWNEASINPLADTPGVSDETRRINGGLNGLEDRTRIFNRLVDELLRRERTA